MIRLGWSLLVLSVSIVARWLRNLCVGKQTSRKQTFVIDLEIFNMYNTMSCKITYYKFKYINTPLLLSVSLKLLCKQSAWMLSSRLVMSGSVHMSLALPWRWMNNFVLFHDHRPSDCLFRRSIMFYLKLNKIRTFAWQDATWGTRVRHKRGVKPSALKKITMVSLSIPISVGCQTAILFCPTGCRAAKVSEHFGGCGT